MKRRKITEEQIISVLKRVDAGEKSKDLYRELDVHEQTYYNWKKKYSGMEVDHLREFEIF